MRLVPLFAATSLVLATLAAASPGEERAARPISAPASAPARTLDPEALRRQLDAAVTQAEAGGFSGVLVVARGDELLYARAVGQADRERGIANTLETRFNLASTGKMFTTIAVMQLVEQGKLALDAPIGRYLPDWPQATVREKVTIRHLLNHTSGLGSFLGAADYQRARSSMRSVSDHLPIVQAEAPAFAPGSEFAYSNTGFLLLGRLVEVASGRDYYEYVAGEVFARAGMANTGFYDVEGKASATAIGYVVTGGGLHRNDLERELRGGPAGGGYSTASDLRRFARALLDGKLLGAASVETLLTPITLPGAGALRNAGLGLIVASSGSDVSFGHPGGGPGMAAEFWSQRRGGWSVVLLGNVAPVPRSGLPPEAMKLAAAAMEVIALAGGPRFGGGARRRG